MIDIIDTKRMGIYKDVIITYYDTNIIDNIRLTKKKGLVVDSKKNINSYNTVLIVYSP